VKVAFRNISISILQLILWYQILNAAVSRTDRRQTEVKMTKSQRQMSIGADMKLHYRNGYLYLP